MRKGFAILLFLAFFSTALFAQQPAGGDIEVDYSKPRTYIIGGVRVSGNQYLDAERIKSIVGFRVGSPVTIPGEEISRKLSAILSQKYFRNVGFYIDSLSVARDTVWLRIDVTERPRVSYWSFKGVKKGEQDDLKEKLSLKRGSEYSEYVISSSVGVIKNFFKEKGFNNAKVNVLTEEDSVINNAVRVTFDVTRGKKVRVKTITYEGVRDIDKFKLDKKKTTTVLCLIEGVLGLLFVTGAGLACLDIVDNFVNSYTLILTGIFEVIIVGWCFRTSKVLEQINLNTQKFKMPKWWFYLSIKYVSPVILTALFVWNVVSLFMGGGIYGAGDGYSLLSNIILGWLIMGLSLISGFIVKAIAKSRKDSAVEDAGWDDIKE